MELRLQACELNVGNTEGSVKNSALRTKVTRGSAASHSGLFESVAMKIRRIHERTGTLAERIQRLGFW